MLVMSICCEQKNNLLQPETDGVFNKANIPKS